MKKNIIRRAFGIFSFGSVALNAQTSVHYGVKGEVNLSNFLINDQNALFK